MTVWIRQQEGTAPRLRQLLVNGAALWLLEGDLYGGLLPSLRRRYWLRRLTRLGIRQGALPPGRETDFAPLVPISPLPLRRALLERLGDCLWPGGDTLLLRAPATDAAVCEAAGRLQGRFRWLRLQTGPGQEALSRQLLRRWGLAAGGGRIDAALSFGGSCGPVPTLYLGPDCAARQRVSYAWAPGWAERMASLPPEEPLLALLHQAGALPPAAVWVKSVQTLDRSGENHYNAT